MAKKILVIDDEPVFVKMVIARLSTHGFEVISANDGESGFEAARKYLPDIILLDLIMPGWSGVETADRLKADSGTSNIPVIFLTGMDLGSVPTKCLQHCDYHVLTKPFNIEELLTILTDSFEM